jgi:hypothetical protein
MSQQPPQGYPQQPPAGYPPNPQQYGPGYAIQGPPHQQPPSGKAGLVVGIIVGVLVLFGIGGGALVWYERAEDAREEQRQAVATQRERNRQAADDKREQDRQAAEQERESERERKHDQQQKAVAQQRANQASAAEAEKQRLVYVDTLSRYVLGCFHPTADYTGGTLGAEYTDSSGRRTQDGHVEFSGGITGHGYAMDYVLHRKTDSGDRFIRVTPGKDTAFMKPNPSCNLRDWTREN